MSSPLVLYNQTEEKPEARTVPYQKAQPGLSLSLTQNHK